jgi:hypothetical protein
MFERDVMKILSKIGCCSEKDYKYGLIENPLNINYNILKKQKIILFLIMLKLIQYKG